MGPVLLGVAVAAAVLAAPFASRRLRSPGSARAPGTRPAPAGRPAARPPGVMTGPFAYDNGVAVEAPEEGS